MDRNNNSLRQEFKYKMFYKDIAKLYSWIHVKAFFKKSFPNRQVNSLYFDTPNYEFAASNMSGESKRLKLRVRWYSDMDEDFKSSFLKKDQQFFYEIKRKSNNLSDKLKVSSSSFADTSDYNQRIKLITDTLSKRLLSQRHLINIEACNAVFLNYKREYFENINHKDVRLTIDKDICYGKSQPFSGLLPLSLNYLIVELKFAPKDKLKVNSLMKSFPFRQVRSSKYLSALSQINRVSY